MGNYKYILCKAPIKPEYNLYSAIQTWRSQNLPQDREGNITHAWFPEEFMSTFYMPGKKVAGFVKPTFSADGTEVTNLEWDEEGYLAYVETLPKWYVGGVPSKIAELSQSCNKIIEAGVDVQFDDETVEHFDMTAYDQANISNMATGAFMGMTAYPYHCKDGNCKVYTAEQIAKIYVTTQLFLTATNTKFNQLKQYVKSFEGAEDSKEFECMTITMETALPEQYQAVYDQMMQEAQTQIMGVISKIQVGGEQTGGSAETPEATPEVADPVAE